MLRITIELLPKDKEKASKVLASGTIENDGTSGSDQLGNYIYKFKKGRRIWKEGRFTYFPRKKQGVWALLYCILWQELHVDKEVKK